MFQQLSICGMYTCYFINASTPSYFSFVFLVHIGSVSCFLEWEGVSLFTFLSWLLTVILIPSLTWQHRLGYLPELGLSGFNQASINQVLKANVVFSLPTFSFFFRHGGYASVQLFFTVKCEYPPTHSGGVKWAENQSKGKRRLLQDSDSSLLGNCWMLKKRSG